MSMVSHDDISSYTADELGMTQAEYGHAVDLEREANAKNREVEAFAIDLLTTLRTHVEQMTPEHRKTLMYAFQDDVIYSLLGPRVAQNRYVCGDLVASVETSREDAYIELRDGHENTFRPNIGLVSSAGVYDEKKHAWIYEVDFPGPENVGVETEVLPESAIWEVR